MKDNEVLWLYFCIVSVPVLTGWVAGTAIASNIPFGLLFLGLALWGNIKLHLAYLKGKDK